MAGVPLIPPFWVLGTDTEVGKTRITTLFTLILQDRGHRVAVTKPLASGCHLVEDELVNADTETLRSLTGQTAREVTPWALSLPTGPWSAARHDGQELSAQKIAAHAQSLESTDTVLIGEGIGGICVPLNDDETFLDVVRLTGWPAVLVVGLKLGCINHTLLTMEVLQAAQIPVSGVVLNEFEAEVDSDVRESSFAEIRSRIPGLAHVPHAPALPTALGSAMEALDAMVWPR